MNIRNALWVLLYICILPKCHAQHGNAVNSIEILPQDNLEEIIRKSTLVCTQREAI